jgi:nucleotide-binding universal stress UspA family protein
VGVSMTPSGKGRGLSKHRDQHINKILIPLGPALDKPKMVAALQALSSFRDPLIVLFHVIELPSRTAPIDSAYYESEFKEAEKTYLLQVARWLLDQGYHVQTKVAVARSVEDGIIEEANAGEYAAVLLLKRRAKKGFLRRHKSVSEKVSRYVECLVVTQLVGSKE